MNIHADRCRREYMGEKDTNITRCENDMCVHACAEKAGAESSSQSLGCLLYPTLTYIFQFHYRPTSSSSARVSGPKRNERKKRDEKRSTICSAFCAARTWHGMAFLFMINRAEVFVSSITARVVRTPLLSFDQTPLSALCFSRDCFPSPVETARRENEIK
jgi:hypothetical protein